MPAAQFVYLDQKMTTQPTDIVYRAIFASKIYIF